MERIESDVREMFYQLIRLEKANRFYQLALLNRTVFGFDLLIGGGKGDGAVWG